MKFKYSNFPFSIKKTKRGFFLTISALLLLNFTSCLSTKDVTYFQPLSKEADAIITKIENDYTPRIKAGDILSITVSSLNKEANEMFNPVQQNSGYSNQTTSSTAPTPIIGFTVDTTGHISLPLLGNVYVNGLSSLELSHRLTQQLQQYLESPTVIVRIANYTVSILGEVARPSLYTISNEKITLPQALALAGDLNIYGKRNNVLIIRENNGVREFARVDLTRRDFLQSPFYYIHSGDIIYVEPMAGRITSTDRLIQLIPVTVSSLTLLVLIYSTFIK